MKIFWLTPSQFIYAVVVATLLAGVFTFASAPHPVIVPVQVVTPVPTPPPVVITEQPAPPTVTVVAYQTMPMEITQVTQHMLEMMWGTYPIVMIVFVFILMLRFFRF